MPPTDDAQEAESAEAGSGAPGGLPRTETTTSFVPPQPNTPPSPIPPAPPQFGGTVNVRVSKRLLWVGKAAYPLGNVTRVYTFVLTAKRREPVLLCIKRVALTLSLAVMLTALIGLATALSHSGGGLFGFTWFCALVALAYSVGDMLYVVTRPSLPALAVETSGPSSAVISSHDVQHLNQLAGSIAHAIDNPETEFQLTVGTLTFSPTNYHFGDNVNMYGGSGNTGVRN